MAGTKTQTTANKQLDHVLGGPDLVRPGNVFVELFDLAGAALTAAGYARLSVVNNATNFPAATGGTKSNGVDFLFPEATADWGDIGEAGLYDGATGGWLIVRGFLGPASTAFTADPAASSNLLAPGHTLVAGDKVRLLAVGGFALPTPLAVNTTYFVRTVAGTLVELSTTVGGAGIVLTGAGVGRVGKFLPKNVATGDQFSIPAGQLTWLET